MNKRGTLGFDTLPYNLLMCFFLIITDIDDLLTLLTVLMRHIDNQHCGMCLKIGYTPENKGMSN